jgi:hypothetical protein
MPEKIFLEPGSVDLFLSHPPFIGKSVEEYGGDTKNQLQNTEDEEEFSDSMVLFVKKHGDGVKGFWINTFNIAKPYVFI